MRARDLSLTIALCASLVAHGVLALVTFERAARQLATIRLAGFPRGSTDVIDVDASPSAVRLGGPTDEGIAPNASTGDQNIRAKDAPGDQALLSRDPQGPGRIGDPPSMSLVPQSDESIVDATPPALASQLAPVLPRSTESTQPFGAGPGSAVPIVPRSLRPRPTALSDQTTEVTSNQPAADPARTSPSESDAFSTLGGIEFRDGRIESRLGRGFKSVRPQLSFAAKIDLMSLAERRIVLKIAIDAAGNVTAVDVLRSTGSDLVDQPVKLAMYAWWFEPSKDRTGRAMPDTLVLPISWH